MGFGLFGGAYGKICCDCCDFGGVVGAHSPAVDADEMGLEAADPRNQRGGLLVAAEFAVGMDRYCISHQSGDGADRRGIGCAGDRYAGFGADVFVMKKENRDACGIPAGITDEYAR